MFIPLPPGLADLRHLVAAWCFVHVFSVINGALESVWEVFDVLFL